MSFERIHRTLEAVSLCFFFFFQAEDGIRDVAVTGVQTCALPISERRRLNRHNNNRHKELASSRFWRAPPAWQSDRKSTRLNSSHGYISYAVFCLKKKKKIQSALATDKHMTHVCQTRAYDRLQIVC